METVWIILSFFVGGFIGMIGMALFVLAKDTDIQADILKRKRDRSKSTLLHHK